jgi:hypothetical protein
MATNCTSTRLTAGRPSRIAVIGINARQPYSDPIVVDQRCTRDQSLRCHGRSYCSFDLHEHSRSLGHAPLIDHNPRGGEKEEYDPADAIRYNERSVAERSNARLKDEFGGNNVRVQGYAKVMGHLMFGILALSVDQLMRLLQ